MKKENIATEKQEPLAETLANIQKERDLERNIYGRDQEETAAVLQAVVDRLQEFFTECASHFASDVTMEPNWLGKRDWLEDLVKRLDPHAWKVEQRIARALEEAGKEIRFHYIGAEFDSFTSRVMQCAYAVGILTGAKIQGASAEELSKMTRRILI
jgi:hypothetical protein